jgi:hypothetical protein
VVAAYGGAVVAPTLGSVARMLRRFPVTRGKPPVNLSITHNSKRVPRDRNRSHA